MADTKQNYTNFLTNYEVKNGYVGDAATLNKAVDQAKKELDAIYGWLKGGETADTGSTLSEVIGADSGGSYINETIADAAEYHSSTGYVISIGTIDTDQIVRSVDGLHKEIFDAGSWS